ncbi:uncharacterized protein [Diadema setosum]|uniref:uncharacterized protein n=1 Tax=Diadema setosum TaxID=31175 RepID=UPI003B3BE556
MFTAAVILMELRRPTRRRPVCHRPNIRVSSSPSVCVTRSPTKCKERLDAPGHLLVPFTPPDQESSHLQTTQRNKARQTCGEPNFQESPGANYGTAPSCRNWQYDFDNAGMEVTSRNNDKSTTTAVVSPVPIVAKKPGEVSSEAEEIGAMKARYLHEIGDGLQVEDEIIDFGEDPQLQGTLNDLNQEGDCLPSFQKGIMHRQSEIRRNLSEQIWKLEEARRRFMRSSLQKRARKCELPGRFDEANDNDLDHNLKPDVNVAEGNDTVNSVPKLQDQPPQTAGLTTYSKLTNNINTFRLSCRNVKERHLQKLPCYDAVMASAITVLVAIVSALCVLCVTYLL